MVHKKKSYEGTAVFSSPKYGEDGFCSEVRFKELIFDEINERIKFDFNSEVLYTVDIGKKDDGYWGGKYSYSYAGERIEEPLNSLEVFKRADGSYLIYGWWNEDGSGYYFCVEFYEA